MAETLLVQTNDPGLLAVADTAFGRFPVPTDGRDPLIVGLYVEDRPGHPRDGRVHAGEDRADGGDLTSGGAGRAARDARAARIVNRTHGSTYLISGGGHDLATVDVDAGVAVGFVGPDTARDAALVRYAYLESMALSMLPRGRGYLAIHAAGVVRAGVGLVIQGPAGAGKSTLALACARRGFGVFAEDTVFVRVTTTGIELWGMPWMQRLLPDARGLFPDLAVLDARLQANGETKIEVDLDAIQPGRAVPCAPSGPVVVVARGTGGPTRVEPIEPGDLDDDPDAETLEIHWPWDGGWTAAHVRGSDLLGRNGLYRLHMNGTPDEAVDALERLVDGPGRAASGG